MKNEGEPGAAAAAAPFRPLRIAMLGSKGIPAQHGGIERHVEEIAARDPFARRVYDSFKAYREAARAWHAVSEVAFYQART